MTKYFRLPKKNLAIAPAGGPPDLSVVYTDRASFMWELKLSHNFKHNFFEKKFQHTNSAFIYPYGPASLLLW